MADQRSQSLVNRVFGKIPLRVILIVPFVIQTSLAVGLTAWFSIRNGEKAVNNLAAQLRGKITNQIAQHLQSYLAIPHQINQNAIDALDMGLLAPSDLKRIGQFFWKQAQSANVSYINYGLSNGDYAGAGYMDGELSRITISETSPTTNRQNWNYATDKQGNRLQMVFSFEDYDHRREPWYIDALRTGKPVWSPVYVWDDSVPETASISIAASRPVYYHKTGRVIGAVGTDLLLSTIRDFLQQNQVSASGETFILERNGLLIAHSSQEPLIKIVDGKLQRLKAQECSHPLIQASANYLLQQFGNFDKLQQQQQLDFWLHNQRQFLQVTPWRDAFGLDWLIVVVIPESDFMEQIYANTRITILLCLAALFVAILSGLLTATWIANSIARLSQASQAIANGELSHSIQEPIVVKELGILSHAFNQMAQQLRESFDRVETALQESEARFTKTFRCSPDAISISTLAEGCYLEINDSFCRLTGLQPEQVISKTEVELDFWVEPDDRRQIAELLKMHGSITNQEFELRLPSGEVKTILLSAETVTLDTQDCILAMMKDISDRKQAEREILKTLAQEKELNELKSRFVALVSHEFRTPLTTILSAAELLQYYEWSPEEKQESFQQIRVAVQHMTSLLEDVLLVGKADAGKLVLKPEWIDVFQLCREIVREMQMANSTATLQLFHQGIPQPARLDNKLVRQILTNLLSNAMKYSPEGSEVRLTLTFLPDSIQFCVQDEGIGIPETELDLLFQAFHRASNVGAVQGTGLGLFIVKKCVDLHNGEITVQSTPQKGTTFFVNLPQKSLNPRTVAELPGVFG